jgi:peptidoglycan/xylan/chitin deacetylase (PgdA/CDA1 family)
MAALWNWLFDQKFAPLALRPDQASLDQRVVSEADLDWDGGPWVPASWDALREAVASGAIEIGSHMASHTPLNWLDEAALIDETAGSKTRLEREFSRPVTTCAYPHGKCSPLAAGVAHRAFEWSFINRGGLTTSISDRSMAPRIHVPGEGWGRVGRDLRFRSWDSSGLAVKVAHALDALVRSVARVRPGAR